MNRSVLWLAALLLVLSASTAACGVEHHPYDLAVPSGEDAMEHGGHHEHASPEANDKWKGIFEFEQVPMPNEEAGLRIRVQDRDRITLKEFDVSHEKLMHLIVVNRELTHFDHLHPDLQENGAFGTSVVFPAEGSYKLFADFVPKGGLGATVSDWITVGEPKEDRKPSLQADLDKKVAGHLEVSLQISSKQAGEDTALTFTIKDAATQEGIRDLEPYLGAVGHVVIVSEDVEQYLHVHPMDERAAGPDAVFHTVFPSGGMYKIWGQFQQRGEVFTIPFVADIQG